ncbi:MAG: hypothetical protein P8J33_16830, partial [Pirellulaceae bacterium]|nr:hypothetical protein [Pirellulaceae bacterium]
MVTDVVSDPAGNAWIANNWNDTDVLDTPDPNRTDSTKGGGSGIVVIYGVAAPTKTPVMGHARAANWAARVNQALTEKEIAALEPCETRGTPFGDEA